MNKRLLALALLVSTGAVLAAGCGGSDDSSSDSASQQPAPTKAAYIAEADAVCADDQAAFQEITKDLPNDIEAPESQAAISDEILPIYRDQMAELRDITPPEGDEETTAAIYDAVEEGLAKLEADPTTIGDPETFGDAGQRATEYGFKVCGN